LSYLLWWMVCGVLFGAIAGSGSVALMITVAAVAVRGTMALALVQTALQGIYSAALYRYAVGHENSEELAGPLLQNAFAAKKK